MKSCLDERELFAMGDSALSPERAAHTRACPACSKRLERLRAMRDAAREATEPAPPDWDAVEARVLFAARAARRVQRPAARPVLRLGLSFAAAAALIASLALVMRSHGPVAPEGSVRAREPAVAVVPGAAVAAEREKLPAIVADALFGSVPGAGSTVTEGGSVAAATCGAVRAALGDDVSVEALDGARFTVSSLDEWRPTVSLDPGAFRVTVTDGPLSPELVVLSSRGELTLLSGTAEVFLVGDELLVRAVAGPVLTYLDGVAHGIGPGESLRRGPDGALDVVAADWTFVAASAESRMDGVDSQKPGRASHGTLPKSAVRDVLRSNEDRIRKCYESALKRYPNLEALPVTARLRIARSGEVDRVGVEGVDRWPGLGRCLAAVLEGMEFPEPTGGEVEIIAPLLLTPLE